MEEGKLKVQIFKLKHRLNDISMVRDWNPTISACGARFFLRIKLYIRFLSLCTIVILGQQVTQW